MLLFKNTSTRIIFTLFVSCVLIFGLVFFVLTTEINKSNQQEKLAESSSANTLSNSSKPIQYVVDIAGKQLTDSFAAAGINLGFLSSTQFTDFNEVFPLPNPPAQERSSTRPDWQPLPLSELIPPVSSPQSQGKLNWIEYGIETPILYAPFSDVYEKNSDGTINFTVPLDTSSVNSPIQQRLKGGIVHLPYSPLPGEVGNSYIIGHTSNYSNVESNYNTIFAPLLQKVSNGQQFTITDHRGRVLNFKVFNTLEVADTDLGTAYQSFNNRRVVTLQGSILENGLPTKRYLIQAELVLP